MSNGVLLRILTFTHGKIYSNYTWAFSYVARTMVEPEQFLHEYPQENSEFPRSLDNFYCYF